MGLKGTDEVLAKIGDDEPIFILRAKDMLAPMTIDYWALHLAGLGGDTEKIEEAKALAHDMRVWQQNNGSKIPD